MLSQSQSQTHILQQSQGTLNSKAKLLKGNGGRLVNPPVLHANSTTNLTNFLRTLKMTDEEIEQVVVSGAVTSEVFKRLSERE